MAYTTPSEIRLRLGLTEDDASDIHLNKFITDAQQMMLKELSAVRKDEEMYGTIDGDNAVFYTENRYIADVDFDQVIDENDLTVNIWTDADDRDTKTSVSISAVDATQGKVTLTSAPESSTTAKVTCDYRFYFGEVDWILVNMATAYLAGYMWIIRDRLLLPDSVGFGAMRWRISFPQWRELYEEYKKIMQRLRSRMVVHGEMPLPAELKGNIPRETAYSRSSTEETI
jgi:hypothetical protein